MDNILQKENSHKGEILLVDDNPKNLQVLGILLRNMGYCVEFALNWQNALEWIKKKMFDLILLDVVMPGKNGFELCKILKADNEYKKIPVIFLSARTDVNDIIMGFEVGAVDYINKPFNTQEVIYRVSNQFELRKSHDIIEQYAKDLEIKNDLILQSIKYGKKIQNAVFYSGYIPLKELQEHFLLFKPRDIISGDFLWSHKIDNILIIGLLDCTGHGVPGALMSMLGVTFLNEIVISEGIIKPHEILNHLNNKVFNAMSMNDLADEIRDGMDASVIAINLKDSTMQFSGALSPVYIIRKNNLIKLIGDKISVGDFKSRQGFTLHSLNLSADDVVYMFSDGYRDQFGGENGLKFKTKSFIDLLLGIHKKPMDTQKEILDQTFENWKGDLDQVDDVTVFGLRI